MILLPQIQYITKSSFQIQFNNIKWVKGLSPKFYNLVTALPLYRIFNYIKQKKVSKVCNTGIYSMSDPNKECIYKFNHTSKSTV